MKRLLAAIATASLVIGCGGMSGAIKFRKVQIKPL